MYGEQYKARIQNKYWGRADMKSNNKSCARVAGSQHHSGISVMHTRRRWFKLKARAPFLLSTITSPDSSTQHGCHYTIAYQRETVYPSDNASSAANATHASYPNYQEEIATEAACQNALDCARPHTHFERQEGDAPVNTFGV